MGCVRSGVTLNGTLGRKESKKRATLCLFAVVAGSLVISNPLLNHRRVLNQPVAIFLLVLMVSMHAAVVLSILCGRNVSMRVIIAYIYMFVFSTLVLDFAGRTIAKVHWPLLVLGVDMLLVMQVPSGYTLAVVVCSVFWLLLMGAEEAFRFGLLDLPGLRAQDGEYGRKQHFATLTNCETLPCPTNIFPPSGLLSAIGVFVLDFIATNGFAREVQREQRSMQRTIDTVQEIASLLAGYDVDKVAQLLETHGNQLPWEMTAALRALEENLRKYKAYLPKTCLPFVEEEEVVEACTRAHSESTESHVSVCSAVKKVVVPRVIEANMIWIKSTLLTVNIKDALGLIEQDSGRFSQLFSSLLISTLEATEARRGVVDIFIGDRIHCSFNASKRCANHATSALHTARSITLENSFPANIGVATGEVLRGDMGCDVMRRFSMVGPLVRDVHGMERAGRFFGCNVLCNRLCVSDAEYEHTLRLIPCKVEVDGCAHDAVAELVTDGLGEEKERKTDDEWMYQIGKKKDWDDYNEVVQKYFSGAASADEVDAAALVHGQADAVVQAASTKGGLLRLPLRSGEDRFAV